MAREYTHLELKRKLFVAERANYALCMKVQALEKSATPTAIAQARAIFEHHFPTRTPLDAAVAFPDPARALSDDEDMV